ncbi:MAG: HAMP domain-containing protein [Acidobacteria bacterium]|nr:HAMP domain-containing protein [Acidobacteriota bacterium]
MAVTTRRALVKSTVGAVALASATALDAALDSSPLHPGTHVLVILVAAALAASGARSLLRPKARPKVLALTTVIVSIAAIALSANGLVDRSQRAGLAEAWHDEETARLERRADLLQVSVDRLLDRIEEPIARARELAARAPKSGPPDTRDRAFEFVRQISAGRPAANSRLSITLFDSERQALAWTGGVHAVPTELLVLSIPPASTKVVAVDADGLARCLALAHPFKDSDLLLVVESSIRSIYDPRVLEEAIPPPALLPEIDRIAFTSYRRPPLALQDLFQREGERFAPEGTSRPMLNVAVRARDRSLLGYVTLTGRSAEAAEDDLAGRHRRAAGLIVLATGGLLLGMAILPRSGSTQVPSGRELGIQITRIAGVWGFRCLFMLFPLPITLGGQALDDPALFSTSGFLGLFGSPEAFLLTAMALLATGVVTSLATTRVITAATGSARRRGAWWCLALLLVSAFVLGATVPAEASIFVKNARVDILTAQPLSPSAARLTMQIAAVFALMGLVLPLLTFAWGAIWAAPFGLARGAPPPPLPTEETLRWIALLLVPAAFGSCVVLELTLQPAATEALREFVEQDLITIVKWAPTERRLALQDAIRSIESFPALADRVAATDPGGDPTLAYDLWQATPLATKRYSASLFVVDAAGRLLSRYSRNFPPILDEGRQEPEDPGEDQIVPFVAGPRGREVRALHVHTILRRHGVAIGAVTVHLRFDFGSLPPLSLPTPIEEALGEESRVSSLLPPWARSIGLSVYDSQGLPLAASARETPLPPEQRALVLTDSSARRWLVRRIAGVRTHELFFSTADPTTPANYLVALSFPEPGWITRAARALKFLAQGVACLMLLMAPWWAASAVRLGWRMSPFRLVETLTRTHYRRLVAAFLTASVAPLTVLAVALTEYITSEIEIDVRERGWTVLKAARDQLEDFAVVQGTEGPFDDAYLYNLTETVGEELSLYTNGVLRATSQREIYLFGGAPIRLDGDVYRAIEIEGQRVVLGNVEIGGRTYRTINGVVSLGLAGEGVLSILLASQPAEVERRALEVYDVLLLTTASVLIFMTILAYALGRRIAAPIRRLSAAAARITLGDLNAEVESLTRDETGDLVASFNAMARALRRQRDDLEQRGNYIEKILLNATTGVLSVDFRGRVVTINPAAVMILGIRDLGAGQDLLARLSESKDFDSLRGALRHALDAAPQPREIESEIGAAAETRHARTRIVPFLEGSGFLIFLDDVTETVRSNRLSAWAEMARRIAHEIKNPLTPIQLSADHLRRVFADGSPGFPAVLEECLRTIGEQVVSLRAIAAQFGDYARVPEMRREPTPMREFLEEVIRPYRAAPPLGVVVECDLDGDLGTMEIDRTMISQALVNLIENALQAMPRGGNLMLRAESGGPPGSRSLRISISDTGVGMDGEALARAFEPYFSTKGTGTGLGMAIARRAVDEHRGRIELSSAPMKGTTARVILPVD